MRRLTVVTGANGTGKSSLYRALRLLADCGRGEVIGSLAREGGLQSVLWAGPEQTERRTPDRTCQGTTRTGPVALELGFASDDFGYLVDLGLPQIAGHRVIVRARPRNQARGGVRGPGDAHRLDACASHSRPCRGQRGVWPRLRRAVPVAAHLPQRPRRIRPSGRQSRIGRGPPSAAQLALLRQLPGGSWRPVATAAGRHANAGALQRRRRSGCRSADDHRGWLRRSPPRCRRRVRRCDRLRRRSRRLVRPAAGAAGHVAAAARGRIIRRHTAFPVVGAPPC